MMKSYVSVVLLLWKLTVLSEEMSRKNASTLSAEQFGEILNSIKTK